MNQMLLNSWWMLALRGALGVLFAVLAIMWPGLTLLALVGLFAAYALLTGIVSVVAAVKNRRRADDWWVALLIGLVGLGAGVIAVLHPALTALVLVLLMGANALVTGTLDIVLAVRLRKNIRNEWMLIFSGIASIIFGVLVFMFPEAGALAMIALISLYAFATGVLLLAAAFRVRKESRPAAAAAPSGLADRRVTADRRMTPAHT
ncbi:MAG: hypothetical protein JWQ23_2651 [Herminiimonas sp.]|nr:hypothetical protein [Herminiimonas sp.]